MYHANPTSEFREDIVSKKAGFEDIARKESDCSSAKQGGDLGLFGRGKMQREYMLLLWYIALI